MKQENSYINGQVGLADNTPEQLGQIICMFHSYIQSFPKDWEHKLKLGENSISSWLLHPLGRNWNLIQDLERLMNENQ